jgi:hypothetical protein
VSVTDNEVFHVHYVGPLVGGHPLMAATYKNANRQEWRKERREKNWSQFFADDAIPQENAWEASVVAIQRRLARRVTPNE